MGNGQPAGRG